jgi:competence protein ComEC
VPLATPNSESRNIGSLKYKLKERFVEDCHLFWQSHPALLYGLASLIGCTSALTGHVSLLFPLGLLYLPLLLPARGVFGLRLRLLLSLFVCAGAFGVCSASYRWPSLPPTGIEGTAEIAMKRLTRHRSAFGESWLYEGNLQQFTPLSSQEQYHVRHAPVSVRSPVRDPLSRWRADATYRVRGRLKKTQGRYELLVPTIATWTPIPGSWSLAEWRFAAKQAVGHWIDTKIYPSRVAGFISGLLTGDFSDRQIQANLGRFGLQHIMAISGFHFTLVTSLLSLVLGILLPRRVLCLMMMFVLSIYFMFLGPGASIARAWVGAMLVLLGQLLGKQSCGLNNLGVALWMLLWMDPTLSQSIAFQFSFLATAAILLFYSWVESLLRSVWSQRSLSQVVSLSLGEQHGVLCLALLRHAVALSLAVHLVMIPMTLYYFQSFPWLSLVFNLFFPFLVSISMLLLLVALPLQLLFPPLAELFHAMNSAYTEWVLNLTLSFPTSFDLVWHISSMSTTVIIGYLTAVSVMGILVFAHMERLRLK